MRLKKYIKDQILNILFNYFDKNRCMVFLFGSFVNGTAKHYSDIDIGILYDNKLLLGDILKIKRELNENIKTLRNIDLVDFNSSLDDKFKELALKEIVVWHYGKKLKTHLKNIKKH